MALATTDEQLARLMRATARGDERSFRALYDATSARLFAVAIKLLQDRSLAEDVLQEAFVQVWHRAGDYHAERGGVLTWLTTIVRYRAIDLARRRKTGQTTSVDPGEFEYLERDGEAGRGDAPGEPLSSAMAGEDARHLQLCLQRLSEDQRRSVYLAFFRGLTHQELSQSLAEPLGTIKSRLRRSLKRLKECLRFTGGAHEVSG